MVTVGNKARAVVLIGHGSLRAGSGAAMIRLAARVREAGVAPIVAAGFLNYSRPSFAAAVARCVALGASEVVVAPYFLVPGRFVQVGVPRALAVAHAAHPHAAFWLAPCLGDHLALAELAILRAKETLPTSGALLLLAHGSPNPAANAPIYTIAASIRQTGGYDQVEVAFMELNTPDIPSAIADLVAAGHTQIVALPFFLQLGGHVAEDLPAAIASAQQRHYTTTIALAQHLDYHPLLAHAIADRVSEAVAYVPRFLPQSAQKTPNRVLSSEF
jgi:sirohydrochlorin ferrochelatase